VVDKYSQEWLLECLARHILRQPRPSAWMLDFEAMQIRRHGPVRGAVVVRAVSDAVRKEKSKAREQPG
jgi:hypothetical protein